MLFSRWAVFVQCFDGDGCGGDNCCAGVVVLLVVVIVVVVMLMVVGWKLGFMLVVIVLGFGLGGVNPSPILKYFPVLGSCQKPGISLAISNKMEYELF